MHGIDSLFQLAKQEIKRVLCTHMHWADDLHRKLIAISDLTNRFDVDAKLLAGSGVKLDRALFPLLSRIGLHPPMSTVELANLVGRDHSTVSRQISKLEELGLINRLPSKEDQRVRLLAPSRKGRSLLTRVDDVRRCWMEDHFRDWSVKDRDQLLKLMSRLMEKTGSELDGAMFSILPVGKEHPKRGRKDDAG